jgi:hypothetical protein
MRPSFELIDRNYANLLSIIHYLFDCQTNHQNVNMDSFLIQDFYLRFGGRSFRTQTLQELGKKYYDSFESDDKQRLSYGTCSDNIFYRSCVPNRKLETSDLFSTANSVGLSTPL